MGLDTVELLMQIEETFGIAIPDRDAERLVTVGQAYRYLLDRFEYYQSSGCLSAKIFYRFRRALIDELGVPREWVHPRTALDDLIPRDRRRAHWKQIAKTLQLELPRLKRPRRVVRSLAFVVLQIATRVLIAGFMAMGLGLNFFQFAFLFTVVGIPLLFLLGMAATEPLAVRFAAETRTVGGAINLIARDNYGWTGPPSRTWAPDEVWDTLNHLVADVAGVDPDSITEETNFLLDLD